MAIIHYQSKSPIQQVHLLNNDSGGIRAYLSASNSAGPDQLKKTKSVLDAHHLKHVATMLDGKPVLEVRGFRKQDHLLKVLRDGGVIGDVAQIESQPGDKPTSKQKWGNRTLQLTGYSYNLGDLGFMYYAIGKYLHEKVPGPGSATNFFNRLDIGAGLGYAAGGIALSRYGHRDQSLSMIQKVSHKIKDYSKSAGIEIQDDSALAGIIKKREQGFFGRMDNLFGKYPSETLNSIFIGVGALLGSAAFYRAVAASIRRDKHAMKEEIIDIGLGAMTLTSAAAGLVIKEKKIDSSERRTGVFGRALDWIEEKPLRATGYGFMISTGFHAWSTALKYKNRDEVTRKFIWGRGLFIVANVVSEILLAISSKGHGQGVKSDVSVDDTVVAATADLILRQPVEAREKLIHQMAGHISTPDLLDSTPQKVEDILRSHIKALETNPWRSPSLISSLSGVRPAVSNARIAASHQLANDSPVSNITGPKEHQLVIQPQQHMALQASPAH